MHFTPDAQLAEVVLIAADFLFRPGLAQQAVQPLKMRELCSALLRCDQHGNVGHPGGGRNHLEGA